MERENDENGEWKPAFSVQFVQLHNPMLGAARLELDEIVIPQPK